MAAHQREPDLPCFPCRRLGGSTIKHWVKRNGLKKVDRARLVLRIGTVINNPNEFGVHKQDLRDDKQRTEEVPLPRLGRMGVAYLLRYREVTLQGSASYLNGVDTVDDPVLGQTGAAAPDHSEEGCRKALLPRGSRHLRRSAPRSSSA